MNVKGFLNKKTQSYLVLASFIAIMILIPLVMKNLYMLKLFTFVGVNFIVVVGLCLLFGYAGQISIGHAAFFGIGAYTSGILTTRYNWQGWPAMVLAMIVTGIIAWLIAIPSLRLKGHYLAMATLGFGEIAFTLFIELEGLTGGPNGIFNIPSLAIGNFQFDSIISYYYLVWIFAFGVLFISLNIINSKSGRALRAIHGNEIAAESTGINISRLKIEIFILSAVFGSLAGSLFAHMVNYISPYSFSVEYSIFLVVIIVVGGLASIWGSLIGTFALTLLPEYFRVFKEYNLIIYALTLLLIMIFVPGGLISLVESIYGRLKRLRT